MDAIMCITFVLLLVSSGCLALSIGRNFLVERLVLGYLFFVMQVLVAGYASSAVGQFNNSFVWMGVSAAMTMLAFVLRWKRPNLSSTAPNVAPSVEAPNALQLKDFYPLVLLLGTVVVLVTIANLATALFTAPHNIDSHTCHLARTAHFLQQDSLNWYPTNMWAQVIHPRNHPVLLAFAYKTGGENATQLVNFSAWLMSSIAIWGVVFNLHRNRLIAWVCALLSLLFVSSMLMATTTQSDPIIAAQIGIAVFMLTSWHRWGLNRFLVLLSLPLFVCFGIKASVVLCLPSIAVVALTVVAARRLEHQESIIKPCAILAASFLLAGLAAIPTGYVQNVFRHGHPLGVEHVRSGHTLEGLTPREKITESGKNTLRYLFNSTSFEGVKKGSKIDELRESVVDLAGRSLKSFGLDLEKNDHSKRRFLLSRPHRNHEDFSWWGVSSVLLIWPATFFCILLHRRNFIAMAFALAFVLFFICQGHAQYDPWRGRYFTWIIPVMIAPVSYFIAYLLQRRVGQTFLMLAMVAICMTSGRALLYRTNSFFIDKGGQRSIFKMDRADQLSRNNPQMAEVIRKFEAEVSSSSRVAIALGGNHHLYSFYGHDQQRQVIYVLPNPDAVRRATESYDFLVFSDKVGRLTPTAEDVLLGRLHNEEKIYLRRDGLKQGGNRAQLCLSSEAYPLKTFALVTDDSPLSVERHYRLTPRSQMQASLPINDNKSSIAYTNVIQ